MALVTENTLLDRHPCRLYFSRFFGFALEVRAIFFTWKDCIRRWNDRGKLFYVHRDKELIRYVLWFLGSVLMSAFMGFVVMTSYE